MDMASRLPEPDWITVCAWCNRVRLDGAWVRDRALVDGAPGTSRVSHGICDGCFDDVIAAARRVRTARLLERAAGSRPPIDGPAPRYPFGADPAVPSMSMEGQERT